MFALIQQLLATILTQVQSRQELILENLALRQQLAVLMRKRPRPRFGVFDRMLWMAFSKTWAKWKDSLHLVTPRQWFAGIMPGFVNTGVGFHAVRSLDESAPACKSGPSSFAW